MKKNVVYAGIALIVFLLLGCLCYVIDNMKNDKNKPAATPKPTAEATVEPTDEATPTPTTADKTTPAPQPTEVITPELSPEAPDTTPEVTPEITEEPTPTQSVSGDLTLEQAKELLKRISADELRLPNDVSYYELEGDDWTTMVRGKECYCINVFHEDEGLAGCFYIAVDGSAGYRVNDDEEFVAISLPR